MEALCGSIPKLTQKQHAAIKLFINDYLILQRSSGCKCDDCKIGPGYGRDIHDFSMVCLNCTNYCSLCKKIPLKEGYSCCFECCKFDDDDELRECAECGGTIFPSKLCRHCMDR